jgi:hypothetical protein
LRPGEITGLAAETQPYATIAIVVASCALWIALQGGYVDVGKLAIVGPLGGDWWRLFSSQFVYGSGFASAMFMFAALASVAIFGTSLERAHGPVVVLVLFLVAGVSGALIAEAIYPVAIVTGANAGALALLCAWSAPKLQAVRARDYYEGDLLGAGAIAAVLLALPFARAEVSWIAGVTGGVLGLAIGFGLGRTRSY